MLYPSFVKAYEALHCDFQMVIHCLTISKKTPSAVKMVLEVFKQAPGHSRLPNIMDKSLSLKEDLYMSELYPVFI